MAGTYERYFISWVAYMPLIMLLHIGHGVNAASRDPYSCDDLSKVPIEEVCQFIKSNCSSESRIPYTEWYYCYALPRGWTYQAAYMVVLLFMCVPLLFVLLGDTAEIFFSPIMAHVSQSIPRVRPRFAGVTFVAFGNGAPDLSSNISAIRSGRILLSAGAMTGAAMFVQCVVGSEVIRASNGVPCHGALLRDVFIYTFSIAGVLIVFLLGTVNHLFVVSAVTVYVIYVVWVFFGDEFKLQPATARRAMSWGTFRDSVLGSTSHLVEQGEEPQPAIPKDIVDLEEEARSIVMPLLSDNDVAPAADTTPQLPLPSKPPSPPINGTQLPASFHPTIRNAFSGQLPGHVPGSAAVARPARRSYPGVHVTGPNLSHGVSAVHHGNSRPYIPSSPIAEGGPPPVGHSKSTLISAKMYMQAVWSDLMFSDLSALRQQSLLSRTSSDVSGSGLALAHTSNVHQPGPDPMRLTPESLGDTPSASVAVQSRRPLRCAQDLKRSASAGPATLPPNCMPSRLSHERTRASSDPTHGSTSQTPDQTLDVAAPMQQCTRMHSIAHTQAAPLFNAAQSPSSNSLIPHPAANRQALSAAHLRAVHSAAGPHHPSRLHAASYPSATAPPKPWATFAQGSSTHADAAAPAAATAGASPDLQGGQQLPDATAPLATSASAAAAVHLDRQSTAQSSASMYLSPASSLQPLALHESSFMTASTAATTRPSLGSSPSETSRCLAWDHATAEQELAQPSDISMSPPSATPSYIQPQSLPPSERQASINLPHIKTTCASKPYAVAATPAPSEQPQHAQARKESASTGIAAASFVTDAGPPSFSASACPRSVFADHAPAFEFMELPRGQCSGVNTTGNLLQAATGFGALPPQLPGPRDPATHVASPLYADADVEEGMPHVGSKCDFGDVDSGPFLGASPANDDAADMGCFGWVTSEVTAKASQDWLQLCTFARLLRLATFVVLFPVYLLLRMTIPFVDPASYRQQWLVTAMLCSPLAVLSYLNMLQLEAICWAVGTGLLLATVVYLLTRGDPNQLPAICLGTRFDFGPAVFSLMGFVMGVMWIDTLANEVVGVITLLAELLHIPSSVMGLTLLAWGNSLSDLFGNPAMARRGMASMALTACFASPLFNMLISFALGFSSLFAKHGITAIDVVLSPDVALGCIFLIVYNLVIAVVGLRNNYAIPHNFYLFARTWYALYFLLACMIGTLNFSWPHWGQ